MALQVAMLVEQRLKELGAEVLITHRGLRPVSSVPYENYDFQYYARMKFAESSLFSWFTNLLDVAKVGPDLFNAFEKSSETKSVFSNKYRSSYFILKEDLYARVKMIEAFQPDITLIIHFDTTDGDSRSYDKTKVYVPGAFEPQEYATLAYRMQFAKHLLDRESFERSLVLGRSVVRQLSNHLNIPFDRTGGGYSFEFEPGIYARNLTLGRMLGKHAVTYIECFYYDDPSEFRQLLVRNHPLEIEGVNYPYSDRLLQVVDAIYEGVVDYLQWKP